MVVVIFYCQSKVESVVFSPILSNVLSNISPVISSYIYSYSKIWLQSSTSCLKIIIQPHSVRTRKTATQIVSIRLVNIKDAKKHIHETRKKEDITGNFTEEIILLGESMIFSSNFEQPIERGFSQK